MNIPFKLADGGRPGSEYNDCQVRVVTITTGLPYSKIHALAASLGRKPRGRFNTSAILPHVEGFEFQHHFGCQQLRHFLREHPEGIYIARFQGHVTSVIDGVLHDTQEDFDNATGYERLTNYWRVLRTEDVCI